MLNLREGVTLLKRPVFFLCCLLLLSCSKNENTSSCSAKYSTDVALIIKTKCAISSCHAAGSALPDLTLYSVVKANADNGRIRANIFDLKIMPPASAAPLTDDEKAKFRCWLDDGAQEN